MYFGEDVEENGQKKISPKKENNNIPSSEQSMRDKRGKKSPVDRLWEDIEKGIWTKITINKILINHWLLLLSNIIYFNSFKCATGNKIALLFLLCLLLLKLDYDDFW